MINYIILWFASCFATTAATVLGFGVSTIVLPIALILFPAQQAILLVAILHCFASAWKAYLFWPHFNWKLLLVFGLPSIVGSIAGALILVSLPIAVVYKLFGVLLMSYALFVFFNPTFKMPATYTWGSIGGAVLGFMAGLFGVQGSVRAAFLLSYSMSKEIYLGTAGIIAMLIDITRISIYVYKGFALSQVEILLLLVIIPTSYLAALFGRAIVAHIPEQKFRLVIVAVLFCIGVYLIFR